MITKTGNDNKILSYNELIKLPTFYERFTYLKLNGSVGFETFGYDRIFNQAFYSSSEWKRIRNKIIVRDHGCDLGIEELAINDGRGIFVHHMNPISITDIHYNSEYLLNPGYLICCSFNTHQAIHYGTEIDDPTKSFERTPFDTCPWKKR